MTTTLHAVQAGAGTPRNDNARGANAGEVGEQGNSRNLNSASADADRKELERLRAQLAFRRHCVCHTDPTDGPISFIITRGAWIKEVADLPSLRAFVEQIGGAT